ncbi:tRNA-dihydrouridine(47) synthase [NAD(P)(+)] [Naematelia encephala]|uniref:tRNA-dihydrouridine(47) synthase [NAD(P)(+)] n=1 Tax=Naematelia encephala TaxID=71784 RepID=A0A1Y2BB96_9TREE|nr:tRNA-dihydrouridine(47) synthase [NAD(P)(+)] [Naematelia encephala]
MTVPTEDAAATARPETSISARPDNRSGIARIKAEYLINSTPTVETASSSALNDSNGHLNGTEDDAAESRGATDQRSAKRQKTRGQNKSRTFGHVQESNIRMCRRWEHGECQHGEACKFAHSWDGYFAVKPVDLRWTTSEAQLAGQRVIGGEDEVGKTLDLGTKCPVKEDVGYCPFGWRCRYLGGHVKRLDADSESQGQSQGQRQKSRIGAWELEGQEEDRDNQWRRGETNWPNMKVINSLKNFSYEYPFSEKYLHKIEPHRDPRLTKRPQVVKAGITDEESALNAADEEAAMNGVVPGEIEAMDVPLRPEEKRRLNWDNGLYLAPLTTVGNLPFRRLCTYYGATITCSEMALAQPLTVGHGEEWALVRRHQSEKMFGVQLAGGYANKMVPAAEIIGRELRGGVDFVDINLGCPIDLVFNQGAGSALMDAPGRLGKILIGMNRALGEIPLTVKFRTGVANGKPNAHKLIPKFATEWGASAMTLHGRSRQQRYSKLADWAYIKQCATTLRESLADAGMSPVPIFGNGDCFSAEQYHKEKEASGVDGIMVARGALIKPWIFTEISERREWDISAVERLDGIRKYAEFGLSHWGSDTQGIATTRRFLCEALSFQHRYIPIGLLERLPAQMNERPPAYRGRSELETLLGSPFAGDWVKISEMFLGKVEDGFRFVPKHKSNAYGGEEAQG